MNLSHAKVVDVWLLGFVLSLFGVACGLILLLAAYSLMI